MNTYAQLQEIRDLLQILEMGHRPAIAWTAPIRE